MSINTIKTQLIKKFGNKKYRRLFVSDHLSTNVAAQIFSLREQEGWSQAELAKKTKMAQARISLLENPNYANYSIATLKRIADVFDVALIVRFVPFGQLLDWVIHLEPEHLAPVKFEKDTYFQLTLERNRLQEENDQTGLSDLISPKPKLHEKSAMDSASKTANHLPTLDRKFQSPIDAMVQS